MAIKIENQTERKLPKETLSQIEELFDSLPREHTRGLDRIRMVEFISDPRLKNTFQASELPGLYHPRQGPKSAWLELAVGVLLPANKPVHKRIIPRLSFKGNLAATLFSLIGQHYHFTLKHSLKKTQLNPRSGRTRKSSLRPGTSGNTLSAHACLSRCSQRSNAGPRGYKSVRRLRRRRVWPRSELS